MPNTLCIFTLLAVCAWGDCECLLLRRISLTYLSYDYIYAPTQMCCVLNRWRHRFLVVIRGVCCFYSLHCSFFVSFCLLHLFKQL